MEFVAGGWMRVMHVHVLGIQLSENETCANALNLMQAVQRPREKLKPVDRKRLDMFVELYSTAELYYAYSIIHRAICDPFSSTSQRVVHNAACYLYTQLVDRSTPPEGICFSHVVYLLAQAASAEGNWKLARSAHLKLQSLKVCAETQRVLPS